MKNITEIPFNNYIDEIVDIALEAKEKKLPINVIGAYDAFKEKWKAIYGSNKNKKGKEYLEAEKAKHLWAKDKVSNVVDYYCKIDEMSKYFGKKEQL